MKTQAYLFGIVRIYDLMVLKLLEWQDSLRSMWLWLCSEFLSVHKGVPQGSLLGPLVLIMHMRELGQQVSDANMYFNADDTIIYCLGISTESI